MNAAGEYIQKQLESKRTELRRLEDQLLMVQGAIAALEATLERVGGSGRRTARQAAPRQATAGLHEIMSDLQRPKLPELAYSVLKEAGKPLTGDQVVSLMAARGCTSSRQSILGAIYRAAKSKDRFVAGRGTFGLLEWGSNEFD